MKIQSEKELNEYRVIIESIEDSELYPKSQVQRIQSWWLREYERIILCGYDFNTNYLHN